MHKQIVLLEFHTNAILYVCVEQRCIWVWTEMEAPRGAWSIVMAIERAIFGYP